MPAEDLLVDELLELPAVAVPVEEPEPPTLEAVLDGEPAEVALPVPLEPLSVPVLTVPLVAPLPDLPVARGTEPPEPTRVARVGMLEGVPAGEVATAGWVVTAAG